MWFPRLGTLGLLGLLLVVAICGIAFGAYLLAIREIRADKIETGSGPIKGTIEGANEIASHFRGMLYEFINPIFVTSIGPLPETKSHSGLSSAEVPL